MTFLLFEYCNKAVKQNTKRVFDKRHAPIYKINTFSQQSILRRNKIYIDTKLTFFVCLFGSFFYSFISDFSFANTIVPCTFDGGCDGFYPDPDSPFEKKTDPNPPIS